MKKDSKNKKPLFSTGNKSESHSGNPQADGRKQQKNSDTQFESDAFSFLSFTRGSVDVRTGSYNFVLPLVKVKGNKQRGPGLELNLSYDHFSTENEGFGIGWSLGLSKFNKEKGKLYLRDGRTIHITVEDNQPTIQTVGIKDFIFSFNAENNNYEIKYKDGSLEVLDIMEDTDNPDMYYLKYLTDEAGYTIRFRYYKDTDLDTLVLYEVSDMDENILIEFKLDFPYGMNMSVFPNSNEFASKLSIFFDNDRRLAQCTTPEIQQVSSIYIFDYMMKGSFLLISRVRNFGRVSEEITYDNEMKLPLNGPYNAFPAVSNYKVTMYAPESKEYTEEHQYEYTENNYTGYDGDVLWNWNPEVIDNIYLRDSSYTYGNREQVYVDGNHQFDIRQTYNKYHLLIEQETSAGQEEAKKINHTYTYYADIEKEYEEQVPQYKSLTSQTTNYIENEDEAIEKTNFQYDEYGNVLLINMEDIGKQEYEYAPPNTDGFIRYPIRKEEYKTDTNNSYRTEYTYTEIPSMNNTTYSVTESVKESKVKDGVQNYTKEILLGYEQNPSSPLTNGLLIEQSTSLFGQFVSKESFEYLYEEGSPDTMTITTVKETVDEQQITTSKQISLYTGQSLLETDSTGVQTKYMYDSLGRILSVTTGYESENAATTSYTYEFEVDADLAIVTTETAPNGTITKTYLDGLNHEVMVKFGENQNVISKSYYNILNKLIEEHTYDYNVLSSESGEKITTDIVNKYSYADFGKLNKIEYSNGIVYESNYDMVHSVLTEYVRYDHAFDTPAKHISTYDKSGKIILEEYTSGQEEVLKSISYEYDDFNNLKTETITVLNSAYQPFIKQYEYDNFDRISSITEFEQGSESSRKTFYEYSPYTDQSFQTAIYVNDTLIGTRTYDGLDRLVEEKIGDNNSRQYEYSEGFLQPSKLTNPRGEEITFQYIQEMNYLPSSIEDVTNQMKFSYTYDPKTAFVTKQENKTTSRIPEYDENNNLKSETFVIPGETYSNVYINAEFGTLNGIEKNNGKQQVIYGYNEKGQIETIHEGAFSTTISYTNDFPKEINSTGTAGIPFICTFSYDEMGRETSRTYSTEENTVCTISLEYNESGKIKNRNIQYNSQSAEFTYQYDVYGRIIEVGITGTDFPKNPFGMEITDFAYQYDDFNNIISTTTFFKDEGENITTFTYDDTNPCKLLTVTNSHPQYPSELQLQYDESGNIKNITFDENEKTFAYDSFEKLMHVKMNEKVLEYKNDFAGRQYLQNNIFEDKLTTVFYNESDKISTAIETNPDDTQEVNYEYMNGQINYITTTSSSVPDTYTNYRVMNDLTGNNYGWINLDDSTNIGDLNLYSPYGFSSSSSPFSIQFAGERLEKETGLYHLGNGYRAYDPLLMRFLQPDGSSPFDGGGINPYTYALGDPINYIDPSGHISTGTWVAIGLGIFGFLAAVFTFGVGAAAAVAAGSGIGAYLATASGVAAATTVALEGAALGTTIASAVLEDTDPETASKLDIASMVLGLGAFATGIASAGVKSGRAVWGAYTRGRVVSGTLDSIEYIGRKGGQLDYLYSANYKGGSLLLTHGNVSDGFINTFHLTQKGRLITRGVTGGEIASDLASIPGYSTTGPLYLMSCGATKFGVASNAQKIARSLNRQVYAFPSKYTAVWGGFKMRNVGDTLTFTGWPTFSKLKLFNP